MSLTPLIVILYDSIHNSVFESQVAQPLSQRTKNGERIILISFERQKVCINFLANIKEMYGFQEIYVISRLPYMGKLALYHSWFALKKTILKFQNYTVQARGPLAGWLALKLLSVNPTAECVIQVRGLLAEELAYDNPRVNSFFRLDKYRYKNYRALEKSVYTAYRIFFFHRLRYEVVGNALGDYLQSEWLIPKEYITVAKHDVPEPITVGERSYWRSSLRNKLNIGEDRIVYCYSGSVKAWQCPEETLSYFQERYIENSKSFLLILTTDISSFELLISKFGIPKLAYRLLCVKPRELYRYLSVADKGLLFRKPHIINWTSRPTKALEYKSVGLPIVHNNTVAYLLES
ncbi:MAG TPA: hypothetical protein VHA52_05175 [Candidatus Babeliaceae bacterium]|nr:hypothetical protein [Candidatus Babeliaceae bacterium]